MSSTAIAAFMRSPYGIVADVKMLNFFRFIGHARADRAGHTGSRLGVRAEFLVPLLVPVRSAAWHCVGIQSAAYSSQCKPASTAQSARRHVPRRCRSTNSSRSSQRNARDAWSAWPFVLPKARYRWVSRDRGKQSSEERGSARLGVRRRRCCALPRHCGFCKDARATGSLRFLDRSTSNLFRMRTRRAIPCQAIRRCRNRLSTSHNQVRSR